MRKILSIVIFSAFVFNTVLPRQSWAQEIALPQPGTMVALSPAFNPSFLKGMVINPKDPFKFDFIINRGGIQLTPAQKQDEYTKLIKYFLAALAVPDDKQWVNLSPYEKDRIIPETFGLTEMGRDLLAEDYLLKQITASLLHPDGAIGKEFWSKVYAQVGPKSGSTANAGQSGTINIPVNTFNKVWITPDKAVVLEKGNAVYVVESHLKVMMEEDYLSSQKHAALPKVSSFNTSSSNTSSSPNAFIGDPGHGATSSGFPIKTFGNDNRNSKGNDKDNHNAANTLMHDVIIPALEKEVNEGQNFAPLRQVFSGMLLATWYKKALKESILGKLYANQGKVRGVDQDPANNQQIYEQYLKAFKKGVFNLIREDVVPGTVGGIGGPRGTGGDHYTQKLIPRKYFSGGVRNDMAMILRSTTPAAMTSAMKKSVDQGIAGSDLVQTVVQQPGLQSDAAMPASLEAFIKSIFPGQRVSARILEDLKRMDIDSMDTLTAHTDEELSVYLDRRSNLPILKQGLKKLGLKLYDAQQRRRDAIISKEPQDISANDFIDAAIKDKKTANKIKSGLSIWFRGEIKTLADLLTKSEDDLLDVKFINQAAVESFKEILTPRGLAFKDKRAALRESFKTSQPQDIAREDFIYAMFERAEREKLNNLFNSFAIHVDTVADIMRKTRAELDAMPRVGKISLNALESALDQFGWSLTPENPRQLLNSKIAVKQGMQDAAMATPAAMFGAVDFLSRDEMLGEAVMAKVRIRDPNGFNLMVDFMNENYDASKAQQFKNGFRYLETIGWSTQTLRDMFEDNPFWFVETVVAVGVHQKVIEPFMSNGNFDINAFVHTHPPMYFFAKLVSTVNAIQGFMNATGLKPDNTHVVYNEDLQPGISRLIETKMPGVHAEQIRQGPNNNVVTFMDKPIAAKKLRILPMAPFKHALEYHADPQLKAAMRTMLNIAPDKPVAMVLSPAPAQAIMILEQLSRIPADQRPVIIVAMRHRDEDVEHRAQALYSSVHIRNAAERGSAIHIEGQMPEVFIVNTQGEMMLRKQDFPGFLYAADIAIMGSDRNHAEPASAGLPILYMESTSTANREILELFIKHGAATKVADNVAQQVIDGIRRAPETSRKVHDAVLEFNGQILPRSGKLGALALAVMILEYDRAMNAEDFLKDEGILGEEVARNVAQAKQRDWKAVLTFLTKDTGTDKREPFINSFQYLESIGWTKQLLRAMFEDNPIMFTNTLVKFDSYKYFITPHIHDGKLDINAFVRAHANSPLYFNANFVSAIGAIRGFMHTTGLRPENTYVAYNEEEHLNWSALIESRLPGVNVKTLSRGASTNYTVFTDDALTAVMVKAMTMVPYKHYAQYRAIADSKEKMRSFLGIPTGRKVVVVVSPSPTEGIQALQGLHAVPEGERPIIIVAMRDRDESVEQKAKELFNAVMIRNPSDGSVEQVRGKSPEVLIVNTQGEMIRNSPEFPGFSFAADVGIVGKDRNLKEVAGLEVPLFTFEGESVNNRLVFAVFRKHNAVETITSDLAGQYLNAVRNPNERVNNVRAASREFDQEIMPRAGKIGALTWATLVLEKSEDGFSHSNDWTVDPNAAMTAASSHNSFERMWNIVSSQGQFIASQPVRGGIDMNAGNLDMLIKRDGNGVPLPVNLQNLDNIRLNGLVPIIINIRPASSSVLLSQLTASAAGAST